MVLSAGCGNAWLPSSSSDNSPSAWFTAGEAAYDRFDFGAAQVWFERLVAADPGNVSARIRLSYTYNAQAGLTPLGILEKITSIGSSGTSSILNLLGLSSPEAQAVITANPSTLAQWRGLNPKLTYLAKSWSTICPLIPAGILSSAGESSGGASALLGTASTCKSGLPSSSSTQSSAVFAALIQTLAEASAPYQTVLDRTGSGQVTFVTQAQTYSTTLQSLQQQAALPGADGLSLITQVTTQLAGLNSIRNFVQGDLFELALADFNLVTSLSGSLVLPADLQASVAKAANTFTSANASLSQYISSGTSAASSATQMIQNATAASATLSSLYSSQLASINANAALSPSQKAAGITALNVQMVSACANFSAMQSAYGLPASVTRPASCSAAGALTSFEPGWAPEASGAQEDFP